MAELGPIQYTNIDQGAVAPSSGRALQQGIGTALSAIGNITEDYEKRKLDKEARDLIGEMREDALTANVPSTTGNPITDDPAAASVYNRLKVLDKVKRAGNSRQAELAAIELRSLLDKAKLEHPSLARQLTQQFGMTTSTSRELAEIGIVDDINRSNAQAAEKEYNRLVDWAYKPVSEKGLGIPPTIEAGSPEFARMVASKSKEYALQQDHEFTLKTLGTIADVDARSNKDALVASLQGPGNMIQKAHNATEQALDQYYKLLEAPPGQRDLAAINEFQQTVLPSIINSYNTQVAQMKSVINTHKAFQTIESRATPFFAEVKAWVAEVEEEIKLFTTALTTAMDDTNPLERAKAYQVIRNLDYMRASPALMKFKILFDPERPGLLSMYETLAKFETAGQSIIPATDLANTLGKASAEVMRLWNTGDPVNDAAVNTAHTFHASGAGDINPSTDVERAKATLERNWSKSNGFFADGDHDENNAIKKSLHFINQMSKAAKLADEADSPTVLASMLTAGANGFLVMSKIGDPTPEQVDASREALADPDFIKGFDVLPPELRNSRLLVASTAKDFFESTRPAERRRQQQQSWTTPLWRGYSPLNLVTVSTEEGELVMSVNEDVIEQGLLAEREEDIGALPPTPERIRDQMDYVKRVVQPMIDAVMWDIKAEEHIRVLEQNDFNLENVDYIYQADKLGWIDFFLSN